MPSSSYTGKSRPTPIAFDEAMKSLKTSLSTMPSPDDVADAFTATALKCVDSVNKGVMGTVVPTRQLNALCIGMEAAVAHGRNMERTVQHDVPATIACIMQKCGVTTVAITSDDMNTLGGSHLVLRAGIDADTGTLTYALVSADTPPDEGIVA